MICLPLLHRSARHALLLGTALLLALPATAQIGRRFPSEKKVVVDPVTGVPLTFLTSKATKDTITGNVTGDSKIYQTHHQWTSDGKWLIFRAGRQAMAVNEQTGDLVQVTQHGYMGMLCIADHSMNLYFIRNQVTPGTPPPAALERVDIPNMPAPAPAAGRGQGGRGGQAGQPDTSATATATTAVTAPGPAVPGTPSTGGDAGARGPRGPFELIRVDLAKLFADSTAGKLQDASAYEHVAGVVPPEYGAVGDIALDPTEEFVYFRVGNREMAAKHLPADKKPEVAFGPRNMGAGPTGLASMNLKTGAVKFIVAVPFQIGHVQTNPFVPGEIVFCWETGGKAPQRTWTVKSDGTGLRPVYPEAPYDWVTHEAIISKDEIAIAIMGHRAPGRNDDWGISGTREYPTGLGIVNLRTREMRLAGQTKTGSGLWHVHGSSDGRWAVGDDFARNIYLIDRQNDELILLSANHKPSAADHPHPTFSADGTRIQIQSAMIAGDSRTMNICIIPVPDSLLKRTYTTKLQ